MVEAFSDVVCWFSTWAESYEAVGGLRFQWRLFRMLYVVCWARRAPRFHKGYTYCLLAGTLIVLFLDYKKKRYVGWTRPTNIPNRQAGRPFGSLHELQKIRPPGVGRWWWPLSTRRAYVDHRPRVWCSRRRGCGTPCQPGRVRRPSPRVCLRRASCVGGDDTRGV